jgi:tRNA (guanine-N(7)-)-methyltransferase subunit TRM82
MPKRLCSIALTPDEHTIIAADKFGDVYSLPLHPSGDYIAQQHSVAASNGAFQASATEYTVHTKGNLEALKQQREQKKVNPRKEGPDFEHKLLLGHVSLLTGVAIGAVEVASKQRHFILTSDRDEHIRVSRYPQAHIIHGYCLGFREFVSHICILPWAPHLMVVGSGEPSLRVFDWQRCQLVSEVVFDGHLQDTIRDTLADSNGERALEKLAVSGIWPVNVDRTDKHSTSEDDMAMILVALEGLPMLFSFRFKDGGHLKHHQTVQLSGNALDVAIVSGARISALVSVDNIHVPGSMMKESTKTEPCEMVTTLEVDSLTLGWVAGRGSFSIKNSDVERLSKVPPEAQDQVMRSSRARGEYSSLGEFLYGLENLRKKRGFHVDDVDESTEAMKEHVPEDAQ